MENEPKYVFLLVLYFLCLLFIVTMFNNISTEFGLDTNYTTSQSSLYITESYADGPRFFDSEDFARARQDKSPYPLMKNGYIYDKETCESYEGFNWSVAATIFGLNIGSETCRGQLNITYYADGEPFDDSLSSDYTNQPICELALLDTSQELTNKMGCTWYKAGTSLSDYSNINTESITSITGSLKQIASFNIDFGLENQYPFLNLFLNFLLIGLPFIIFITYVIIIGRKIVGFT